jgi:hypothetical protein
MPPASILADRTAPPKDLEIRPKQVKAWIDALPLAQTIEASKKLSVHLAALNRSKFDLDDRLQILEIYHPVVAVLLEELDAIYGKAAIPMVPRAREALALARDLASGLATAYRIAISEKAGKLISFGAKKQLPLLIVRAMEYLATALRASYKSYTPAPQGIWREVHHLYLYAEQQGVSREIGDAESKATVFDVYTETLLLSLTDPYRLAQGEADKVLAQIRTVRGLATLGKARPETRAGGHFLIPCDTDKPPKPLLSASDDTGGPNWLLLDANPVVDKLRQRKQAMDSGNVSATMSRMVGPDVLALIAKLLVLWGDPPRRSSRRNPMETTVAICVGIKAIGHFVSMEPKLDPEAEAKALREGITMPLTPLPTDDASRAVPVFEWDVVNQSAGGMKVRRAGPAQPIAVGEAVGIKLVARSRWTLGVVRWLTIFDEGGMEFGVQFLSPLGRMVSVTPTLTSVEAKLALLLPDADDPSLPEALLTPPNTFADLREYELEDDGVVTCVRATSLIEKTGRFELFHVSPS